MDVSVLKKSPPDHVLIERAKIKKAGAVVICFRMNGVFANNVMPGIGVIAYAGIKITKENADVISRKISVDFLKISIKPLFLFVVGHFGWSIHNNDGDVDLSAEESSR